MTTLSYSKKPTSKKATNIDLALYILGVKTKKEKSTKKSA